MSRGRGFDRYDANGNVTKKLDALGYEAGTGTTHQQRIDTGYGVEYTYNLNNQVITELDPVNKPHQQRTDTGYGKEYTYNLNNQVITELDPVNKQKGLLFTTKYAYDALGRVETQTDAKGYIASYEYDDTGNLLYARMQKDASSPKQVTEHNQYDFIGRLTAKTDGNGNTATFISARECKNASEGIYTKPSRNRT